MGILGRNFMIVGLFFLLGIGSCGCIVGGHFRSIKTYPFLCLIAYEIDDICHGTIIMSNWVLTAAKCVDHGHVGINRVLGIKIGITTIDKDPGSFIPKKTVHVHPHFLSEVMWAVAVNDIALIQLEKHLEFGPLVHPVGLAFDEPVHDLDCTVAGWGVIHPEVYVTYQLKYAEYWPKPGENSLKDIQQSVDSTMNYCNYFLWRESYTGLVNENYHICCYHWNYNWTGKPLQYNRRIRSWGVNLPVRRKRQAGEGPGIPPDMNEFWWWYHQNTEGPSYYDYGAPLMCFGRQLGIFSFPVAKVDIDPARATSVYTKLEHHLDWINTVIEVETHRQAEIPAVHMKKPRTRSFMEDLAGSENLSPNSPIIITCIILIITT